MPTYVLKNMYHAHVVSLVNYCNIIWANVCPTNLTPLTLILKRAIRNVTKSEFFAHTEQGCQILFTKKSQSCRQKKPEKANYSKNANSMLKLKINIYFMANVL